ncbi:MAG: sensor histidine kinase [Proteobacteria bacterium]|nr:sensor histidine kinase [Pseudomonadota bacterium]
MIKKKSLKQNLIISLSSLLAATLIVIYSISFVNTHNEIQEVFDAHLAKSAKLIYGLVEHEIFEKDKNNFSINFDLAQQEKIFHRYEYKIHSQIWSGNNLVYNSSKDQIFQKPEQEGFKDVMVDKKYWRAFTIHDAKSDITILVLEKQSIRNKLTNEIIFSLFLPLLLSFIPLLLIIVATVNKRLQPLDKMSDKIKKMSTKTLQPFHDSDTPLELKPFVNSFNALLARLSESMESERRFTDYAAHELKTPLAAITIQAQLLLKNKDEEKREEYLNDLMQGINRTSHMVNQLLTLTRLAPEDKNIEKENFNLRNLLEVVLKNYLSDISQKNLKVELICDLEEKKLLIDANRTYIEIMIRNLIDNAVKYSLKDKKITIFLTKKNNLLHLKITNYGAEISAEDRQKIFNNFYRVSSEIENDQGCGLGLAIAKKIIDLHGGSISFESKNNLNSVNVCFS